MSMQSNRSVFPFMDYAFVVSKKSFPNPMFSPQSFCSIRLYAYQMAVIHFELIIGDHARCGLEFPFSASG